MLNGKKLYHQIDNNEPVEYTEEQYVQAQKDYDEYISKDLSSLIRQQRNSLLAKSDWTQYPDCPLNAEQKTAWITYRQALRNLPAQSGFPTDVVFPEQPS
jgi:hypothetical protein